MSSMRSNESGLKFSAESAPALFASRNTGFTNGKASVTHTIQAVWSAGGGGSTILIKIDGTQVANNYKVDLPTSLYSSNAVSYTITG